MRKIICKTGKRCQPRSTSSSSDFVLLLKLSNVVGIFVVKRKCYGNREKSYESNCNVIVQKKILPKKLSTGVGEGGNLKCCVVRKIFSCANFASRATGGLLACFSFAHCNSLPFGRLWCLYVDGSFLQPHQESLQS